MALTASRTTVGFEPIYNKITGSIPNPVEYELTPNTAFATGDAVVWTNALVAKAAAGASGLLGVMAETFTTTTNPSAPTGAVVKGRVYDNPFNVYRCTFSDHLDSTATGGTTTTLVDTALSTSADDRWNGALVYIYDGANAGEMRTVKDYTGASDTLTFEKPFPVACDTTTKYIMLGNAGAAGNVINVGSVGVDLKDENTIDADATIASEAGPLVVLAVYPKDLMMDVMFRKHLFNTP